VRHSLAFKLHFVRFLLLVVVTVDAQPAHCAERASPIRSARFKTPAMGFLIWRKIRSHENRLSCVFVFIFYVFIIIFIYFLIDYIIKKLYNAITWFPERGGLSVDFNDKSGRTILSVFECTSRFLFLTMNQSKKEKTKNSKNNVIM
jgi:hypothetical protein